MNATESNLLRYDSDQSEYAQVDKTDRKTNQKPQGRYVRNHVTPRAKGNRPFRESPLVEPSLEVIHILSSKQGDALGLSAPPTPLG